jgi:hypothetical protein
MKRAKKYLYYILGNFILTEYRKGCLEAKFTYITEGKTARFDPRLT